MITDVKISFQYSGDNQWRIDFIRNNEEGSFQHIREIELNFNVPLSCKGLE